MWVGFFFFVIYSFNTAYTLTFVHFLFFFAINIDSCDMNPFGVINMFQWFISLEMQVTYTRRSKEVKKKEKKERDNLCFKYNNQFVKTDKQDRQTTDIQQLQRKTHRPLQSTLWHHLPLSLLPLCFLTPSRSWYLSLGPSLSRRNRWNTVWWASGTTALASGGGGRRVTTTSHVFQCGVYFAFGFNVFSPRFACASEKVFKYFLVSD